MSHKKNVVGVFRDRLNADAAYEQLWARGFSDNQIHVMMSDETRTRYYSDDDKDEGKHTAGTHATEGMGVGGAVGAVAGASLAAVAAIGTSLVIPGLGLVIAGPVAAALAGAGAGAAAGGLVGALVGLGIPESNAEAYEQALRDGGIVLGVEPRKDDDVSEIKKIFRDNKAENVIYT